MTIYHCENVRFEYIPAFTGIIWEEDSGKHGVSLVRVLWVPEEALQQCVFGTLGMSCDSEECRVK